MSGSQDFFDWKKDTLNVDKAQDPESDPSYISVEN